MTQISFANANANANYAGKRKQPHKELLMIEMDQVVQRKGLYCPDRSALPEQ